MKKTLIGLAVASALAAPIASVNAADFSGFANVQFSGGTGNGATSVKNQFGANGELDITHAAGDVTVRADINLSLSTDAANDSGSLEQALAVWKGLPGVTIIGGVFNDPIGQDAEDIIDQRFTSHSAVYNVLDQQTALSGNNVAGLAAAGMVGPATVTVAFLNDLHGFSERNSFALNINLSPSMIPGLDLELGYATQQSYSATNNPLSAGDIIDLNASYNIMSMADIGFDYLAPSDIVDSAYDIWVKAPVGMGVDVGLRYSAVSWSGPLATVGDSNATSLYASYAVASNLDVALEYKDNSADVNATATTVSGIKDGQQAWLNITGTF